MRRLSLAQMEALLAIAKLGSFHAAAKRINVTQPTISLRIRELESTLGARLFARAGRRVVLTPEGTLTAGYAEQALGLLDEMEARLRAGGPPAKILKLGSSEMIAITALPEIVRRLEGRYPGLHVDITVANSFALQNELISGNLDIALLANPTASRLLRLEPLALASIGWLGGRSSNLPNTIVTPEDLAGVHLLTMPAPAPLHEMFINWCTTQRMAAPALSKCSSLAVIAKLVLADIGVSLLPVCVLADEIAAGAVVRYRQLNEFPALRIYAASPRLVGAPEVDGVIHVASEVMKETQYLFPMPAV